VLPDRANTLDTVEGTLVFARGKFFILDPKEGLDKDASTDMAGFREYLVRHFGIGKRRDVGTDYEEVKKVDSKI